MRLPPNAPTNAPTLPPTRPRAAIAALAVAVFGCGTSASTTDLPGSGTNPGNGGKTVPDASFAPPADAGPTSFSVAVTPAAPAICKGQCVSLSAGVTGGKAPYAYQWNQGLAAVASPTKVCPDETTTYTVKASDSSGTTSGEIPVPDATSTASVTVTVSSDCSEGGVPICNGVSNDLVPASGRYMGTFNCGDGGVITGPFWVDLAIDPGKVQQSGAVFGKWVILGIITFTADLQGTLDCSTGELQAAWVNGLWGLPGPDTDSGAPVAVLPTGSVTGDLSVSVVSSTPGAIAGKLDWLSSLNSNGSGECHGTYTATLQH